MFCLSKSRNVLCQQAHLKTKSEHVAAWSGAPCEWTAVPCAPQRPPADQPRTTISPHQLTDWIDRNTANYVEIFLMATGIPDDLNFVGKVWNSFQFLSNALFQQPQFNTTFSAHYKDVDWFQCHLCVALSAAYKHFNPLQILCQTNGCISNPLAGMFASHTYATWKGLFHNRSFEITRANYIE